MRINIIEGQAGCDFAVQRQTAAVIVDALRASATAAMLLAAQAQNVLVVSEVAHAWQAKRSCPEALLFGERGGVPPEGFDFGNSPLEARQARHRPVIFTTTTGARRLVAAWGAPVVLMATTINAAAAAQQLLQMDVDEVTLIPAGLAGDATFDAQEDWAAAAFIAQELLRRMSNASDIRWGVGQAQFKAYERRLQAEGLETLFWSAPHADKLRDIGQEADIHFCATTNVCDTSPTAVEQCRQGVIIQDGASASCPKTGSLTPPAEV